MADPAQAKAEAVKERLIRLSRRTDERFGIQQKYDHTKKMATEHPVAAVMIAVTVALCSIPVACFIAFVLGSLFFTLMGFLIIEGFLLTIGAICVGVSLMIMGTVSLGMCCFIGATYLAFVAGQKVYGGVKERIPGVPVRYKAGYKASMAAWKAEQQRAAAAEKVDPDFEMPDAETVTTYTETVSYS